jgi:hypothetical protein
LSRGVLTLVKLLIREKMDLSWADHAKLCHFGCEAVLVLKIFFVEWCAHHARHPDYKSLKDTFWALIRFNSFNFKIALRLTDHFISFFDPI